MIRWIARFLFRRNSHNAATDEPIVTVSCPGADHPRQFHAESATERFRTHMLGDEGDFLAAFLDQVRENDIVLDVGSNIGLYSIFAAAKSPTIEVIAIEPDPDIARRVNENATLNDLTNVNVLKMAVGDQSSTATLYTDGLHGYSPSLFRKNERHAPSGMIKVSVRTIDELVENQSIAMPTIVKMDIEGGEGAALRGMSQVLSSEDAPRALFIELHTQFLLDHGSSVEQCRQQLTSYGYVETHEQTRNNPQAGQDEIHTIWTRPHHA